VSNGNTDVQLVISAKDAGSQAILAITNAINKLTSAQSALVEGAGPTSSLLDQLGSAMGALSGALDKVDSSLDRATAQFERQTQALTETKEQLGAVQAQSEAATQALARLEAQMATGPQASAAFYEQLAGVSAEQKVLTAQANQLTASLTKQEAAVVRTGAALQQMQSATRVAGSAATIATGASPQAVQANAAATAQVNDANRAFEIMALEAAEAADKEAAAMGEGAAAAGAFARSLAPMAPAVSEAGSRLTSLRTTIMSTVAALFSMPSAEERAAASTQLFGERSSSATQAIRLLRYEIFSLALSFVGPYGVIEAIGSVLTAYQALQSAEQKLGVVFNQNEGQVRSEMQFLRDLSIQLGLSFSTLADQYSSIAISAQGAGLSLEQTRKLFTAVADAARVLHLSQDDTNRVFLAFREMLSKGTVQSVQVIRQLGNDMPSALKLLADSAGVSTEKFIQMMKAGQVFADSDFMSKVADRITAKYGKQLPQALQTAQTQIGRFEALLQQAEVQFGNGGFIDQLNTGLSQFNKYLQSSDARAFFSSLGATMGRLVSLVPVIARNFNLITDALKAWIAVKIEVWLLGMISKMGSVATAARAMWVAIGGLPGLLTAGAAFALEGFLGDWLTGIDDATAALDEHQRILDAVQKGYEDAGRKVDDWAKKIKDTTAAQILANLNTLKAQAAAAKQQIPQQFGGAPDSAGFGKMDVAPTQLTGLAKQLDDIIQKFKDGRTSYEDFKKAVSDFGVAHTQFLPFIKQVLDTAQNFGQLQDAIKRADAMLDVFRGHATAADLKTLGLDAGNGLRRKRRSTTFRSC
jgi:tape measure domain-containing protein